jgi:glycosyltransferase involved in cell wall biosynthesis
MISDRETGILVSEKNEDELSDALISLLTDEGARRKMGAMARKRFLEKFTLPVMAERVEGIYRSLLDEHSKKSRSGLQ